MTAIVAAVTTMTVTGGAAMTEMIETAATTETRTSATTETGGTTETRTIAIAAAVTVIATMIAIAAAATMTVTKIVMVAATTTATKIGQRVVMMTATKIGVAAMMTVTRVTRVARMTGDAATTILMMTMTVVVVVAVATRRLSRSVQSLHLRWIFLLWTLPLRHPHPHKRAGVPSSPLQLQQPLREVGVTSQQLLRLLRAVTCLAMHHSNRQLRHSRCPTWVDIKRPHSRELRCLVAGS